MYLLFPGRHHLLTNFQFTYIQNILQSSLSTSIDVNGHPSQCKDNLEAIIFAVTSANHSNTRRNPLPFYLRAMALQEFSRPLNIPSYVFGIDDVGHLDDFASYTLKKIKHESDSHFNLTPDNTIVLCSTPVLAMYEKLGYKILPAELIDKVKWEFREKLPWDIVEHIANLKTDWLNDSFVRSKMHPASIRVWSDYSLASRIQMLFRDSLLGSDGDLTSSRDYNTYVRQMDEIAQFKYNETASFIKPGRIGDIGCAVGSWIRLISLDKRLRESDLYGIEASRYLFEICRQRKENNEFGHPFVFFSQKNAISGLVFEPESMNTIHTSSLTHEIESYGGRHDLISFIRNRYRELSLGGVWINRDVVGPENKDDYVYMWLSESDGENNLWETAFSDREQLKQHIQKLSTHARFLRFARDFRNKEGYSLSFKEENITGQKLFYLRLGDACEFLSKKDYPDNWQSEMHETFCFFSFSQWKQTVEEAGFRVSLHSHAYLNPWFVPHRYKGKVKLFSLANGKLKRLQFPVTNMLLVCEK